MPSLSFVKFVYPTLLVFFGSDTISRWSFLSGVYARGSKRSHTGGKCVTYRGLHTSEINHSCVSSTVACLEYVTVAFPSVAWWNMACYETPRIGTLRVRSK